MKWLVGRVVVLVVCGTLLLLIVGCGTYVVYHGHTGGIRVSRWDGTNPTTLKPGQWKGGKYPQLSPDEKWIAYYDVNEKALCVMERDGSNWEVVTKTDEWHFSWSPDSKWLAYSKSTTKKIGSDKEIYKIRIDGTGDTRLTTHSAKDIRPQWSPRGDLIAFDSNRRNGDWDIWVMESNGSNPQNLTAGFGNGPDHRAVWDPDGEEIVFGGSHSEWGDRIYWVRIENGAADAWDVFSQYSVRMYFYIGIHIQPAWRYDGKYIFYATNDSTVAKPVNSAHNEALLMQPSNMFGQGASVMDTSKGFSGWRLAANLMVYYRKSDPYGLYCKLAPGIAEVKIGNGWDPHIVSP